MSPMRGVLVLALLGFPRVSGDEPADPSSRYLIVEFSPRERG